MKIIYRGKTKTGKEIVIRYPEIVDLEKMMNYINALSDEKTFIRSQGEHETLESERKFLKNRLKEIKDKKAIHILVFCGDKLVGGSDVHMLDKTEKHVGIFGITVAKDFRGEGIGETLMEQTIEEAKKELKDLKIITLEVYGTNNIAQSLYKKMGFKKYGMLQRGIVRQGKFEDAVLMYLDIFP